MIQRPLAYADHLEGEVESILALPGCEDAEGPLRAWHTHVASRSIEWRSWADVRASFARARVSSAPA